MTPLDENAPPEAPPEAPTLETIRAEIARLRVIEAHLVAEEDARITAATTTQVVAADAIRQYQETQFRQRLEAVERAAQVRAALGIVPGKGMNGPALTGRAPVDSRERRRQTAR